MRVSNRTAYIVSNISVRVENHQGLWIDEWVVPEIQPDETTDYNDFVIEWEMIMTDWVGYLSGSYQTTGQTTSVWLNPAPYFFFTLVIDDDGYHKE